MEKSFIIREAVPKDALGVETLYRLLLPDHPGVEVLPERLNQIAANPDSFLFVCEEDNRVIGTVHLHLCMDALSGNRPFGVIERVIVSPDMQGKGFGAALMRHAEQTAVERGALKIMLSSASRRGEAHLFYAALGYDGEGSKLFKKYL